MEQDVRVKASPQPCVSPALCQGHADSSEYPEADDELDCAGELAADFEAESSCMLGGPLFHCARFLSRCLLADEEEGEGHSLPPPSPYSTPTPSPPHSSPSSCCEPPSTSQVVGSNGRGMSRYFPMGTKSTPVRERKSIAKCGPYGYEAEKPREAVSLVCLFCRMCKVACRQPPGLDSTACM